MRILYLNHNVAGVGTYQRVIRIAAETAARGHDTTVVTTSRTRRLRGTMRGQSGVRVIEAPDLLAGGARQGWDPWNTCWRIARLTGERPDIIHAFDSRPAVIGPALALRGMTRAPLVLDWADWWGRGGTIEARSGWAVRTFFGPVETWFEEAFRTGATANTVISNALRDRCVALGVPGDRIVTLPNGCVPPRPVSVEERAAARAATGVPPDAPLILHLGNIQPPDAVLLFEAFRFVRRRLPAARLVLIGYRYAVPDDLRRTGSVIETGFLDSEGREIRAWLAAADAGVIPLRDNVANRARWPSKINDYLAHGLPVVATEVGPGSEYVARSGAGLTCVPDAPSLARALCVPTRDPAARAAMGEAGLRLAGGELAWGPIVDDLLGFYERWSAESQDSAAGAPKTHMGAVGAPP